jgi:hypothetical protein
MKTKYYSIDTWKHTFIISLIELSKNIHTSQMFPNVPMYITKGYVDTLVVQLSLAPFTTNGTWSWIKKILECRMKKLLIANVIVASLLGNVAKFTLYFTKILSELGHIHYMKSW